ncbi:amidohydrolase family protein [Kitasatospora azatica]|uniref:hypothetical protein n=1 Tax=Kitasatospora azatica TaxID=58347 RepID=UPI000690F567|nr:hypothetical protein [Kitasatospora azatica]
MFHGGCTDVHQHLWPAAFVEQLRLRRRRPLLDGWTLHLPGEPPHEIRPEHHDPVRRAGLDPDVQRIAVSLSSPLGIEHLPPDEAAPLLDAWHAGVQELPAPFVGWASPQLAEPDLDGLSRLLVPRQATFAPSRPPAHTLAAPAESPSTPSTRTSGRHAESTHRTPLLDGQKLPDAALTGGLIGLQVPATALRTPQALKRLAPLLAVAEAADRPVLVHPGPEPATDAELPAWWPAVVGYVGQLQAAWWSWHTAGRALLPRLRICFVAAAGLAPVHHERFTARGGGPLVLDPRVFVDTSSYGRQALDSVVRVLGIDALVLGSDRPYAAPTDPGLGAAAAHAVRVANPRHLLEGVRP